MPFVFEITLNNENKMQKINDNDILITKSS